MKFNRKVYILLILIAAALTAPLVLDSYSILVLSEIFVTALFALSLNLVLGYGGMLQFHQAVFLGVSAYSYSLFVLHSGSFIIGIVLGPAVAVIFGTVMGVFLVRLSGIYFGMLTIALGQLVWAVVFKWYSFTGGGNGIPSVPLPGFLSTSTERYEATLIIFLISAFALYKIVNSPFGLLLKATGQNNTRAESISVNTKVVRLTGIVLSSFFAGISGISYVIYSQSVSPDILYWKNSAEILVACLVGGIYTFAGPIVGSAVIILITTIASQYMEYIAFVLGIILLVSVLFMPDGIVGFIKKRIGDGIAANKRYQ
ncbi:MAG: branched-chain amino acid ABC transporter permease [Epsilonproteobacteria bacterium]|nr:branched-chain amino acid ABC transporter permease [Campylobacterota bacterium]